MAEIIPPLNELIRSRMTTGERKLTQCLKSLLEDDCLCWYNVPIGEKRQHPDFIILNPGRGLLFLEVKDWKPGTLNKIDKLGAEILTDKGLVRKDNPLEQARQYIYPVINMLSRDPCLRHKDGKHKGKFLVPYGWGAVLTNIDRQQIHKAVTDENQRKEVLPDHQLIYKDELSEQRDAKLFQKQLWGMFNHQFGNKLSTRQIDRIRWHLFPELRIDNRQVTLFDKDQNAQNFSDNISMMDIKQEKLARGLGEGHRVIHGVAGSGKTLILGYRCQQLAQISNKPILVLCFNRSLAAMLRSFISAKGIGEKVEVHHFHGWCAKQLKTHDVDVIKSEEEFPNRQVQSVIKAVDNEQIPRAQYGAILIDEGHDFEAKWLKLIVQMVDPESKSLLFIHDDAQAIYKQCPGLGFTYASVGIQARGRTTILNKNYRNTREILQFAYEFILPYVDSGETDDGHIVLIEPEAAGTHGDKPEVHQFNSFTEEMRYAVSCLQTWHKQGASWADIAVLYFYHDTGGKVSERLKQAEIPHLQMKDSQSKDAYNRMIDRVTVSTFHSSKGLEFSHVVVIGVGKHSNNQEELQSNAKLLYVGITRAQKTLLLTTSTDDQLSCKLLKIAAV